MHAVRALAMTNNSICWQVQTVIDNIRTMLGALGQFVYVKNVLLPSSSGSPLL